MNQIPANPDANEVHEPAAVYAKTDVTALVEVFQSMAQDNKKGVDELTKLHRNMYNSIIQKQNDELENYRRGALRQSMVHVLRSVAEIYNENNQDFDTVENPISLLKYIMSQLKELLQDNDVQIVQSKPGTPFDRKFMKTQERHTVSTEESAKDRTIVESIKPGYIFFGEPLLQELVGVWKYAPKDNASEKDEKTSDEVNCMASSGNIHLTDEITSQESLPDVSNVARDESAAEKDETGATYNNVSEEDKKSNGSEDANHA